MARKPQPGCADVRPKPSPRDIPVSSATPALPGAAHALFGPALSWQFCALAALGGQEETLGPPARQGNHPAAPPLEGVAAGPAGGQIPAATRRGIFRIIREVFTEPMFLLLVACGMVYLLVGEPKDALLLLGFVVIMMGITIFQEGKTEKTLDALRNLSSPRAIVIRNGERVTVPGREVVAGDLNVLSEGERVPADGILIWSSGLTVDESLLTGESVPVRKLAVENLDDAKADMARPGGEDSPYAYSGSLVVSGGILAVITLAMAMLPEEFPVVLTIFLALGAWRISRKNVLARKMSAVETLGAATVLCSDKTGTITQNRMSIRQLWVDGAGQPGAGADSGHLAANGQPGAWSDGDPAAGIHTGAIDPASEKPLPLPEAYHALVEFGVLASRQDPFDPMEKAFLALMDAQAVDTDHLHPGWDIVREYPLSKEFLSVTHVWRSGQDQSLAVAVKGAPETVMDLCHLSEERRAEIAAVVARMAEEGLRVLGVASGSLVHPGCVDGGVACAPNPGDLPATQHDFDFAFHGLVGLADPIRPAVPEAIRLCRQAGVRVVMITGDYPRTAANIARQIGLDHPETVITGPELAALPASELAERVRDCQVFARVIPEQKLLLVQAMKANGEVVAMTGDGVNDAPALKAAHIGVAMGQRGTDVAREASALVLLDDDFSSIVAAVRTGRRIFDNLKKAMSYIVSVHIPIAGMSLLPVLLAWKEPALLPVHIVFLELIIDPACSIVFEGQPEEKNIMDRPPRKATESLFGTRPLLLSVAQGLTALGCVLAAWLLAGQAGLDLDAQRAVAFITLIVANLAVILSNRSWTSGFFSSFATRNKSVPWVVGGAMTFLALVVAVPFLRELFHFSLPSLPWIAVAVGLGLLVVSWFEVLKLVARWRKKSLL